MIVLRATCGVRRGPALLCLVLLAGCTEPLDDPRCGANADCQDGHRCDADGRCVPAGELTLVAPALLPPAYAGEGYSQLLSVQGGLAPYAWRLETEAPALAWLTVDAATGELRHKVGQAPGVEGDDLPFRVFVRDASQAGQGEEIFRELALDVLGCRGTGFCYQPEGDACREGTRACVDGHLAEDCVLGGWSLSTEHCGPLCEPCPAGATSACYEGRCACGTSPPCAGNETCCSGVCVDVQVSAEHCGLCGRACALETLGVVSAHCAAGLCDYDECLATHLECDGDRQNGCEIERGMQDCAACGDACGDTEVYLHTQDPRCDGAACQHTCAPGFDSCDLDPGNGCETPLNLPERCGSCGRNCQADDAGHVCLPGAAPGEYRCGCQSEADCAADRLCCDHLCVPRDEQHCADCLTPCTIGTGGLHCSNQSGAWRCECSLDDDCRGTYEGWSRANCASGFTDQCACGPVDNNCAGTPADICCYVSGDLACTSLYEDASNCGRCGVGCGAGEACAGAACTCAGGSCPNNSGAPNCVGNNCVCFAYEGQPCPAGQYCCAMYGCCLMPCADASYPVCSNACLDAGRQWCESGCCESCDPDTGCS